MTGIAAVQARMAEIKALVEPATVATTTSTSTSATTGTDFAAALAAVSDAATTTTAVSDTAVSGTVTGESLVAAAEQYQGTPYVWGGESLDEGGLDCSGLVQRSLADLGVTGIPRTAREQMTLGEEVPSLDQARPGDLVVFNGGKHIGIYVGDGKMIDAPKPGDHVRIRDVYTEPTTIRRILPSAAEVAGAGSSTAASSASAGQTALALLAGSGSTSTASLLSALSGAGSTSTASLLSALSGTGGTSTASLLSALNGSSSAASLSTLLGVSA